MSAFIRYSKSLTITYKTHRFLSTNCVLSQRNIVATTQETDTQNEREKLIRAKVKEYMDWYEEFTGLREVRVYQDRVIRAQEELLKIQEHRRVLNEELLQITLKRNELQARFHTLSRDDPEWYHTIGEENRFLLEERKIRNHLQNVERDERDYFTYMSNTVRDSHEKQRWQSDRTKYWSLILTIISSFLTYLVSDWRHKRIIQSLVDKTNETISFPENVELQKLITILRDGTTKLSTISTKNNVTSDVITSLDKKINTALTNDVELKNSINKISKTLGHQHDETVQLITSNKQINFLGENQQNLDEINAIHGPSFGLGILCTFGVLALLKIMFSSH